MAVPALKVELTPDESRQKFFSESKFQANNQKYGLFSYTGTLAISARPYFPPAKSHRDSEGKVIIGPHNFLTSPTKTGKLNEVYFSSPEYISDPYRKTSSRKVLGTQSSSWKPAGPKPEPYALFPHEASEVHQRLNKKGPDGKVIIEPRNFFTSPAKKGTGQTPGVLIGPLYEYMNEPYDRKKKLMSEERKKHIEKMQSESFKPMDHGGNYFSDNKATFGSEGVLKTTRKIEFTPVVVKHSLPFYPPGVNKQECFEKYPEHSPDTRRSPIKTFISDKPSWKDSTVTRTIPSPSISTSAINLRNEYSSLKKMR